MIMPANPIPRVRHACLFTDRTDGIIVDLFAGGGGASIGIESAFKAAGIDKHVDVAINHDPNAIACHTRNHPLTDHLQSDVFEVSPSEVADGRRVRLLWASPDCTDFSKAKGGKPNRSVKRRSLAWVVIRWAFEVSPDVIMLENVEEFEQWGMLDEDGMPIRDGSCFDAWVDSLKHLGYEVQWRLLRACNYGAPTIRRRLFVVARRDGRPITWPKETHGKVATKQLKPYRTAADIIDWAEPMLSIFATPEEAKAWGLQNGKHSPRRPLAENTLKRIATGVKRYVLDSTDPFILSIANYGSDRAQMRSTKQPLSTVTAWPKGGHHALVTAFIAKHYTGVVGAPITTPLPTTTASGAQNQLVAVHMIHMYGSNKAASNGRPQNPLKTITAGGLHAGVVSAFLTKYYGNDQHGQPLDQPLHTIPTKERFGLVTVQVEGEPWAIVDIAMRMLTPRELARAQGFQDDYVIDEGPDGEKFTKSVQVRLIGNSVCPPMSRALVSANVVPCWYESTPQVSTQREAVVA